MPSRQKTALSLEAHPALQCESLAAGVGDRVTEAQALADLVVAQGQVVVQDDLLGIARLHRGKDALLDLVSGADELLAGDASG